MKKLWLIFPALLIAGLVMTGCPNDTTTHGGQPTGDITWTLKADGDADNDTTKITITLSRSANLSGEGVVTLTGDNVEYGDITGGGRNWEIPITEVTYTDNVSVTITQEGIEADTKEIMVYKVGMEAPATYTVEADGAAGTETSTKITFTFNKEISELEADDITFDPPGIVTKGALTETENLKVWELAITGVSEEAELTVTINKTGTISHLGEKVQVHFKPLGFADLYDVTELEVDGTYEENPAMGTGKITGNDLDAIVHANHGSLLRISIDISNAEAGAEPGSVIGAVGNFQPDDEVGYDRYRNLSIVWPAEGNTVDLPTSEVNRYFSQIADEFLYVNAWDGVKITKVELCVKKTADEKPTFGEGVFMLLGVPSGGTPPGKGKILYVDYREITGGNDDWVLKLYITGGTGNVGRIGPTEAAYANIYIDSAGVFEITVGALKAIKDNNKTITDTKEVIIDLFGNVVTALTRIELCYAPTSPAIQTLSVFKENEFLVGGQETLTDGVTLDNGIKVAPATNAATYSVTIEFGTPVDITDYTKLVIEWNGVFAGDATWHFNEFSLQTKILFSDDEDVSRTMAISASPATINFTGTDWDEADREQCTGISFSLSSPKKTNGSPSQIIASELEDLYITKITFVE